MITGYTTGVFDLYHVGHSRIIKRSRELCDFLIVGVSTDELVLETKGVTPFIPFEERCEILRDNRFVDKVVEQTTYNKIAAWQRFGFERMFVGSDWQGSPKWQAYETEFEPKGVEIVYLPYTEGTSSTQLRNRLT